MSILPTCLRTSENALALISFFTNKITPNFANTQIFKIRSTFMLYALSCVPLRLVSIPSSLYRSLWGEYHVQFKGRPSGLGVMGSCKVYRPLFTGPPWQVQSQPISHYRPLLVRKMKKKIGVNLLAQSLLVECC